MSDRPSSPRLRGVQRGGACWPLIGGHAETDDEAAAAPRVASRPVEEEEEDEEEEEEDGRGEEERKLEVRPCHWGGPTGGTPCTAAGT